GTDNNDQEDPAGRSGPLSGQGEEPPSTRDAFEFVLASVLEVDPGAGHEVDNGAGERAHRRVLLARLLVLRCDRGCVQPPAPPPPLLQIADDAPNPGHRSTGYEVARRNRSRRPRPSVEGSVMTWSVWSAAGLGCAHRDDEPRWRSSERPRAPRAGHRPRSRGRPLRPRRVRRRPPPAASGGRLRSAGASARRSCPSRALYPLAS